MAEDESEFGEGSVEGVVVVFDDLVPMLETIFARRARQQEMRQVRGRRQELRRMEVDENTVDGFAAFVFVQHVAHSHVPVADGVESSAERIRRSSKLDE